MGERRGEAAHRRRALGDAQPLLERTALAEALHHLVEGVGERADLAGPRRGTRALEVARGHAPGGGGQRLHRARDRGGEVERQQHAEREDRHRGGDAAGEGALREHREVVEDAGDHHVAHAAVADHDRDPQVRGGRPALGRVVAQHAAQHELGGSAAACQLLADVRGSVEACTTSSEASAIETSRTPSSRSLFGVVAHGLLQVRAAARLLLGDLDRGRELFRVVADAAEHRLLAEQVQHEQAPHGEHEEREHHQLQLRAQRAAAQSAQKGHAHASSLDPGKAPGPSGAALRISRGRAAGRAPPR